MHLNTLFFWVKYDLDMLFAGFLRFTLTNLPMTESKWPVTCNYFTLINVPQAVLFQLSDAVHAMLELHVCRCPCVRVKYL